MRVLVTGWPSFQHGEATAGDVLGMRRVRSALARAGIDAEAAWSPGYRPGEPGLPGADPDRFSHVVFACGPVHGWQVRELHRRYARCHRIAVGVSVLDRADPAVAGFQLVLPRDDGAAAQPDLAATATEPVPVAGVVLAPGQPEYGDRRRHDEVHGALTRWLAGLDCARVPLDTRLATGEWRLCATPDQFAAAVGRLDVLVTTRLHGLVFALGQGVPVLAADPVAGGGKVTAQARALGWPAVVAAEDAGPEAFGRWWHWCLTGPGRAGAAGHRNHGDATLVDALVRHLRDGAAR